MDTRERGITMVDMVVAVAVLAMVLGMAYPGFKIANDTIATSGSRSQATRVGGAVLREILREVRSGDVLTVNPGPKAPSVTLRRVRGDTTLAQFETENEVPFTADIVTLRFHQSDALSESELGEDLNRDGDRKDLFALGRIEIVEGGRVRPLAETTPVILGLPGYTADVDGDGKPDPLFALSGRSLAVDVHLFQRAPGGAPMMPALSGSVHLRNVQR